MAQQNKTTTGAKKGAAKAKTTNAENQTKANETIEAAPVVPKRPSRIEDSTLVYVKSTLLVVLLLWIKEVVKLLTGSFVVIYSLSR